MVLDAFFSKGYFMNDEERINPGHTETRAALRVIGPLVAAVGLVFVVIGLGSFFASFGSFQPPRYFWCAFVGLPLLGLGVFITKVAYMGRFFRYVAGESAPVVKDTFNYMAEGTQQGIRTLAGAVGDGLRGAESRSTCSKCGQSNDAEAKFCRKCGAALGNTCASCGHVNDPAARFCDTCGNPISVA
jgi:hypothetical protein